MKLNLLLLLAVFGIFMYSAVVKADDDDDDDGTLEDAVFERERRADAPCSSPENLKKKQFFMQLEVERKELKGKNDVIYTEIMFYQKGMKGWPTVLGWTMNGQNGVDDGKFMERKGIVTEYKVKFVDLRGQWKWLENPDTGKFIFKNTATLTSPTTKTEVKLKTPIRTLILKVYPQNWEGVPFFEVNAQYCPYVPPTVPTRPPTTRPPPMTTTNRPTEAPQKSSKEEKAVQDALRNGQTKPVAKPAANPAKPAAKPYEDEMEFEDFDFI